jgi:DNA-binding Lrp family transcriptional regulator
MVCGYVLIVVEPTKELDVYGELLKMEEFVEVCPVLGPVDFIGKVSAKDHNAVALFVIKKVRRIKGVTDTKTFVEDEFLRHLKEICLE